MCKRFDKKKTLAANRVKFFRTSQRFDRPVCYTHHESGFLSSPKFYLFNNTTYLNFFLYSIFYNDSSFHSQFTDRVLTEHRRAQYIYVADRAYTLSLIQRILVSVSVQIEVERQIVDYRYNERSSWQRSSLDCWNECYEITER